MSNQSRLENLVRFHSILTRLEDKIGEVASGVITWILIRAGWRCPFS